MARLLGILGVIIGLAGTFLAINGFSAIMVLAAFAGDGASTVVMFGLVFVTMLSFATALVLPSPKASSVFFLLSGLFGILLGTTTLWIDAAVIGAGAIVMAILMFIRHRLRRSKISKQREIEIETAVAVRCAALNPAAPAELQPVVQVA